MSEQTKDGGAAFPIPLDDRPGAYAAEPGMSLRDYFAAKALPEFLSLEATGVWNQSLDGIARRRDHALQVAKAAYTMADAMLKARQP